MNKDLVYPIKISKLDQDDYYFSYPLKGLKVIGGGESLFEALELAQRALEFALFDMYEDKKEFPTVTEEQLLNLEKTKGDNEYITLIKTDLKSILQKFGDTPVKKTISIPQYMDFWLNQNDISISKYLQSKIDQDIKTT